jgi:hypothetical protein
MGDKYRGPDRVKVIITGIGIRGMVGQEGDREGKRIRKDRANKIGLRR